MISRFMLVANGVTDSRIMGALPVVGAYGAANNLNQVSSVPLRSNSLTWSGAGNLVNDGKGTVYVHDGNQRLVKASKVDGTVYNFRYDADGLRRESVKNATGIDSNLQFTGGIKARYVTSATEEVADLDGANVLQRRYIPGPAIDERVAQIEPSGAVKYIHVDRQNSVVAVSDSAGNVISRRAYGAYGETVSSQITEAAHPFGYTGRRWESDLGLYYYRARWYDPETGTFLETDPVGAIDYINMYSYVGLNPMNATDPTGMFENCTAVSGSPGAFSCPYGDMANPKEQSKTDANNQNNNSAAVRAVIPPTKYFNNSNALHKSIHLMSSNIRCQPIVFFAVVVLATLSICVK